MVESNIRHLSRKELVYETTKAALKDFSKNNTVPDCLTHYLQEGDRNRKFYSANVDENELLHEAEIAVDLCGETADILKDVLEEQTCVNKNEVRVFRNGSELSASVIQSPYDTDATYRVKGRGSHIGYVANVIETVSPNGTVILDYEYECNTYSDSRFLKDAVDFPGVQDTTVTLVADGAYSGKCNTSYAEKRNIRLITTNLTGKPRPEHTAFRKTEEFRKYSAFRNWVECIPAHLRRCGKIDCMPVRGKNRTAFYFGCKIGALNVRKLCISLQRNSLRLI